MSKPLLVRDLMSPDPTTLDPNEPLSIADTIMRLGRIRHLPVVDEEGTLVGVVSQRDLFRGALTKALGFGQHGQEKVLESLRVKEVAATQVITVGPDTPLQEAAELMQEHKIGCLPVMENERLVGILTEGDFVAYVAGHG